MTPLETIMALAALALAVVILVTVVRFIRRHRADDPEMDALWLALGPLGWLLRGNNRR